MKQTFTAWRYRGDIAQPIGEMVSLQPEALSDGDVLIRTEYASVNFKDALSSKGINRIIRRLPRIGGIDLSGVVEHSEDDRFKAGQSVVVHGFGVGVDHDGGYSQMARVPADWVLPLPEGISTRQASAIGVAGYTSALAIHTMEQLGLTPDDGDLIVTGATGGSGSIAVNMLANRGFKVFALSRKPEQLAFLTSLGAQGLVSADEITTSTKPLEARRWAGAVDTVGGDTLAWLLRTCQQNGIVTAFGNAAGAELNTTVLPFILRGVRLIGINANSPMPLRRAVWNRIATDLRAPMLDELTQEIGLDELPGAFDRLLQAKALGRTVVRMK